MINDFPVHLSGKPAVYGAANNRPLAAIVYGRDSYIH